MTARQLVERFGSPLYTYDLAAIGTAHADLVAQLPNGSHLLYSVKANPHPQLIRHLRRLGCGVEVSSTGELDAALVAGVSVGDIMHNGPAKSRTELEHAVNAGVRLFSVDSAAQLQALGHVAAQHDRTVDVLVRVNGDSPPAGAGLTMTGTASQFGIDAAALDADPDSFRHPNVAVRGLHFYLGTNLADEDALIEMFGSAVRLADRLRAVLPGSFDVLDLGGGFAAPYARAGTRPQYPRLRRALTDLLARHMPHRPAVYFESGRYLTAECGRLFATVQDVKESKGRIFVLLDSGINHLGGMAGLRRVPPVVPELITTVTGRTPVTCDVVGPLCTPLDTWIRRVQLPRMRAGDVVQVPNVGAYGLTGSLIGFLSHEPPVEIVLDGDHVVDVSRLALVRSPHKEL